MAISALVEGITVLPDGTVRLILGETPSGDSPGQPELIVVNPPEPPEILRGLIGSIVWGGAGELLVGETIIAERIGYTRIRLLKRGEHLQPPRPRKRVSR